MSQMQANEAVAVSIHDSKSGNEEEERKRERNSKCYRKQKESGKRRKYQDARTLKNRDSMVRSALGDEMHLYPAVMAKVKLIPIRGDSLRSRQLITIIHHARKDWEKRASGETRQAAINNIANSQDTGTNACDASAFSSICQTVSPPHNAPRTDATVGKSAGFDPELNCAKRSSADASAVAALITPHKPQDVPGIENAESNGNFVDDDDDDDDNDMHCFDNNDCVDAGAEVTVRTIGTSPGQGDNANAEEDEKVDSKPAASTPPTAKASADQGSEGTVGLVLIPLKGANEQIASFATSTKYMYWPALIYPSYEAFESTFPLDQNNRRSRQVYATVNRERMLHETHEIAMWTQHGIFTPGNPQPVQVAILFGSDVPPCGTRSYPIYPKDITIIRGGVPQMPQVAFKPNGFKDISEYANNPRFQEAVQLAKKYKTTKDTKMFASL